MSTRAKTDALASGLVRITNSSVMRSFLRGATESIRGQHALVPISCAAALNMRLSYFEVALTGSASVGVSALTAAYGFCGEDSVGVQATSFGYLGDDGSFVGNCGRGTTWTTFGPAFVASDIIGCGVDWNHAKKLFFTRNGQMIGYAPMDGLSHEMPLAMAISLHAFGDSCLVHMGHAPFAFDIEEFCLSLAYQ